MRKHNEEMVRLQVLVSDRDLELQQLRAQIAGPKVDLEACKLERDDFKKRLQETERRYVNVYIPKLNMRIYDITHFIVF